MSNNRLNINDIYISKHKDYCVSCIYGIYVNDELVYLGSTKNAIKRWQIHKHYIIKPYDKCKNYNYDNINMYKQLRDNYYSGDIIEFGIIGLVKDYSKLNDIERVFLKVNKPILNTKDY